MKKQNKISAFDARTRFGELLDEVRYSRSPCIIERHGKPVAVIIDFESYKQQTQIVPSSSVVAQYNDWLERAVEILKQKYHPEKIILFGSVARGSMYDGSDIDLLIVKETDRQRTDRIGDVLHLMDIGIPIEPVVLTPKEFEERLKMKDPWITHIMSEGKILHAA